MTATLSETLFVLLSRRQSERIARGWPETPDWAFCSETGTCPEPRNVERVWGRLRRRAQKLGVRPFPLHSTRHSWATWALQAGKNIRWVADQLRHADALGVALIRSCLSGQRRVVEKHFLPNQRLLD